MKLIVLDVDGVLSMGEAQPLDLMLLERLAALNRKARHDTSIPAVTLNTGRPSPYVEAIMQMIEGWQPALYESGGGMYFPQTYRFQQTPLMTPHDKQAFQDVLHIVDKALVQTGKAYWQPGKTVCHTLFAIPPLTIDDVAAEVNAAIAQYSENFIASTAVIALNIQPRHISKGTGQVWLAEATGIDMAAMGGVGDSATDTDFLSLVAHSAAPANATDDVKAVVKYVSPYTTTVGLHDILDFWEV